MSLWGKTDTAAAAPKWVNLLDLSTYPDGTEIIFVDQEEAQSATAKAKGIHGAGWWLYYEYVDSASVTRYKTELLVAISETALAAGDQDDDAILGADSNPPVVTISADPANATDVVGQTVTFTVTAAADPVTDLTYQWYVDATGVGDAFVAIEDETASTYTTPELEAGMDGYLYNVVVSTATPGTVAVTSANATLTVTV